MSIERQRVQAGTPQGGEFSTHNRPDSDVTLSAGASQPATKPSYDDIRTTPTSDDYDKARAYVRVKCSNESNPSGPNSWAEIIGARAPRTAGNLAKYDAHLDTIIDNSPTYTGRMERSARFAAAQDSYARAFEQGVPVHPVAEEYFEGYWTGDGIYSENYTLGEQQNLKLLRAELEAKNIKPSAIIGTGMRNPRVSAFEYLDVRDREVARHLATRGRSRDVLARNATSAVLNSQL